MPRFEDDLALLYADAVQHLTALLHTPDIAQTDRERTRVALHRLHRAYGYTGIKDLAVRAAELNALAETLHSVTRGADEATIAVPGFDALQQAALDARSMLVRAAREAFPGSGAPVNDDPDVVAPDDAIPPHEPAAPALESIPAPSQIPADRPKEYLQRFDACIVRPDKIATVNWYVKKVQENAAHYRQVGEPLEIPWWFIAAIHALESGFALDRHLHNGDPLTARTTHVPTGRPPTGVPPFTWEQSAADALHYMRLDQWHDWSVAGALYQWETYNGFGYRKHSVPSPYLWSFSNQYEKGRYVRDGVYDPNAISNQCGAGTLLRTLVNQGIVQI